jgi:hypothetical protein
VIPYFIAALFSAMTQQGSAEAFVAKIPAANIPSTVTLSTPGANGMPGKLARVPLSLAFSSTSGPSSFQFDILYDPSKLTFVSATGATSLSSAGIVLLANVVSAGDVRLTTSGATGNAIPAGVIANASFLMASPFGAVNTPVTLASCQSTSTLGSPLSTGCSAGTVGLLTCAVTGDSTPSVADIQATMNQALGLAPPTADLNGDGVVNLADVQLAINAVMGKGCVL